MMVYVRRCVVPGRFLRAVRSVFAYVYGRQSVTAGEIFRLIWPLSGVDGRQSVTAPVWRALDSLSCCHASYDDFLGMCLREGGYL